MDYIVYSDFNDTAICGELHLSEGTSLTCIENLIMYDGKIVCVASSENAHNHFTRNDDGLGMRRGELIQNIALLVKKFSFEDIKTQLPESIRSMYLQESAYNMFHFKHEFYIADILDLETIESLLQ